MSDQSPEGQASARYRGGELEGPAGQGGRSVCYLFTTVRGNRIHISRLQIIGQPTMQASGITRPDVSMHTLRHSMATLLLQDGSDLVPTQQPLGHTRLGTTAVCSHLGGQELRLAVGKHPLAREGGVG